MALWAGLLTCATSGHGAQSREEERGGGTLLSVQPTQPGARGCPSALPLIPQWLWTGAWGGRMGTWAGLGPGVDGWRPGLDGDLAGQLELYWPLGLMRAQEARCRAAHVRSPQSC